MRLLRLKNNYDVRLIDARSEHPKVAEVIRAGFDLDAGMVLVDDGRYIHGAECVHRLALLTTRSDTFNRVIAWVFRHPLLARTIYPVLVLGRRCTLSLLGIPLLSNRSPSDG